jgi:8-oxo-dGTP pyrophosphatase MutT (NUDIX family)
LAKDAAPLFPNRLRRPDALCFARRCRKSPPRERESRYNSPDRRVASHSIFPRLALNIFQPPFALPNRVTRSVFLAGPTPREPHVASWRPLAIDILRELGFDGEILSPEPPTGPVKSYVGQIEWERRARLMADLVFFWVPRELSQMPGFTTNVEFGEDWPLRKMLYGRPDSAPKNRYLDARWRALFAEEPHSDLREMLARGLAHLGAGALREGPKAQVPLDVWRTRAFQKWLRNAEASGNALTSFELLRAFAASHSPAPLETPLFAFLAKAGVWDHREKREQAHEFFLARTDISCVAAFFADPQTGSLDDPRVMLTRETRQAANNEQGAIFELPGGSSKDESLDPRAVAAEELHEETGVRADPSRFQWAGERQLAATALTHTASLFAVQLTEEEGRRAFEAAQSGAVFGSSIGAGDLSSERVALLCPRLSEAAALPIDWSTLGMLHAAWAQLRARG